MCIKVLRGSSSKGKFKRKDRPRRRRDHLCGEEGDCRAREIKDGEIIRCVVVRTKQPTLRPDGSYVRFDHNAAVVIDADNNPKRNANLRCSCPRTA